MRLNAKLIDVGARHTRQNLIVSAAQPLFRMYFSNCVIWRSREKRGKGSGSTGPLFVFSAGIYRPFLNEQLAYKRGVAGSNPDVMKGTKVLTLGAGREVLPHNMV